MGVPGPRDFTTDAGDGTAQQRDGADAGLQCGVSLSAEGYEAALPCGRAAHLGVIRRQEQPTNASGFPRLTAWGWEPEGGPAPVWKEASLPCCPVGRPERQSGSERRSLGGMGLFPEGGRWGGKGLRITSRWSRRRRAVGTVASGSLTGCRWSRRRSYSAWCCASCGAEETDSSCRSEC